MAGSDADRALDVFSLGEALVVLVAADGVPLVQARRYDRWVAGAESNVVVGVARLGHTSAFCGRVGGDVFGDVVRQFLTQEGVDASAVRTDPDRPTGLIVRDAPAGQPLSLTYYRTGSAGAALVAGDVPLDLARRARVTHVTGITACLGEGPREAVDAALNAARDAGRHVCLDPNVRRKLGGPQTWRDVIEPLARRADTVLVGDDELDLLTGDRGTRWFLDRGASLVVVKHGAAGATATDGTTTWHAAARAVPVVDPVGAGDAFAAGWISARLRGVEVEESLREAAVVASCVVATRGDTDGLPSAALRDHLLGAGSDVMR